MHCTHASSVRLRGRTSVLGRNRLTPNSLVNDVVITATGTVASGSFVLSSLQLLNAVAQLPGDSDRRIDSADDDDAFVWSVATVLSLIPVFNFTVRSLSIAVQHGYHHDIV